jgi:hypothetical protein
MSRISYRNYPTLEIMGNITENDNIKIYKEDSNLDEEQLKKIISIAKNVLSTKNSKELFKTYKVKFVGTANANGVNLPLDFYLG